MAEEKEMTIKVGDPSALGLISYAIALMSLSFIVASIFPKSDMVMAIIVVGTVGIGISGIVDFLSPRSWGPALFKLI